MEKNVKKRTTTRKLTNVNKITNTKSKQQTKRTYSKREKNSNFSPIALAGLIVLLIAIIGIIIFAIISSEKERKEKRFIELAGDFYGYSLYTNLSIEEYNNAIIADWKNAIIYGYNMSSTIINSQNNNQDKKRKIDAYIGRMEKAYRELNDIYVDNDTNLEIKYVIKDLYDATESNYILMIEVTGYSLTDYVNEANKYNLECARLEKKLDGLLGIDEIKKIFDRLDHSY